MQHITDTANSHSRVDGLHLQAREYIRNIHLGVDRINSISVPDRDGA